ncbi:7TM diverse intracellular signaling domain-containing protein [Hydrogenimonas sp.]
MIRLFITLFVFSTALFGAVDITPERIDLLPQCEYLPLEGADSLDAVKNIADSAWKKSTKKSLSLGFRNQTTLWIKCRLENPLNKSVMRVLETDNPRTEYVTLYADGKRQISGSRYIGVVLDAINPYFKLHWNPHETKTVYLAFRAPHFSLNAAPILWQPSNYVKHENTRHLLLGLFFGAMGALLIYNFFIFIFTKDIAYFWYCGYLLTVITHQMYYTHISELYFNAPSMSLMFFNILMTLLMLTISNFTRHFLDTGKYMPLLDKFLKYMPFYTLFAFFSPTLKISLLIFLSVIPIFIIVAFRALQLNLRLAKYYAAGWTVVWLAWLIMALINFGLLPSLISYAFFPQLGFAFEALIFSIGLADRINRLKAEKEAADRELIRYHKQQHAELQTKVEQRTFELTKALKEKNLLLKEVHHRVKNNLQMIVSLIQLQAVKTEEGQTKDILLSAQSRIGSIGALHEILYRRESISEIDTNHYFRQIVSQLLSATPASQNIAIDFDITADLDSDRAIYCGLIINELVTNALKHAFGEAGGEISVFFKKENDTYLLAVHDNGKGFEKSDTEAESLGLALVKSLAVRQLKGSYQIDSDGNGTRQDVRFPA